MKGSSKRGIFTDYQDADGHLWLDVYNGIPGCQIAERDDGFIETSIFSSLYFSEYKDWPPHEKRAMKYAGGKILDIGCGPGRHALYLQGKGCDVLGVDVSRLALKVCRLRGLEKTRLISINDITPSLGIFDTILLMGHNFGLFENPRKAARLLKRFHNMTSEKGRIIASSLDPHATKAPEHLEYHRRNRRRGKPAGQVRLRVRYKKYATPWFDYLFVSREQMEDILEGTGWKLARCMQAKTGSYVAIMEKHRG